MEAIEWKPKNGERVWVKVFSNWSLGTYIGFDTVENVHLVREDASGGGSLMSSSLVLPESANPNVPKELTAVEWLVEILVQECGLDDTGDSAKFVIEQAKEMEKKQIIDAHSDWSRITENLPTRSAEQYYNQTFKSK